MSLKQALLSTLHLFVLFSFFALSFSFFALGASPEMRRQLGDHFIREGMWSLDVGAAFLGIALLLSFTLQRIHRGGYLQLRGGAGKLYRISPKIVKQTIAQELQGHLPEGLFLQELDVSLLKGRVEMHLTLKGEGEKKEQFLDTAEQKLQELLAIRFGYFKPFRVTLRSI